MNIKAEAIRRKMTKKEKTSKEKNMDKIRLVLAIIAVIFSWIPIFGLIFVVISVVLVLPEAIRMLKTKKKWPTKFTIACTLTIVALALNIFTSVLVFSDSSENNEVQQEYTSLKEVDVNGMTVSEACAAVREEGWKVGEVAGTNIYATKSDCSDNEHKVTSVSYHKEKYYSWGEEKSDYESVTLYFNDETETEQDEEEPDSSDTSSSSNSSNSSNSSSSNTSSNNSTSSTSSGSSSSSTSSSSTGYQSIYDKYAARLRAECPSLSMTECAELANEGVSEMADYMLKASGTDGQYATYEDWAGKLYDVYMESAR